MEITTKICTKCKTEKSIEHFELRKDSNTFRGQCNECRNLYAKNHYEKNKEKKLQQDRNNYEKNKERKRLWGIEYRERVRPQRLKSSREYYQKNKEKITERIKKYHTSPQGIAVLKNSSSRRRAKIKDGTVTNREIKELIMNAKKCYWCNCTLKVDNVHIDHYQPLSKGGTHSKDNLVVTCPTCNLQKNAKDPLEFAQIKGRLL